MATTFYLVDGLIFGLSNICDHRLKIPLSLLCRITQTWWAKTRLRFYPAIQGCFVLEMYTTFQFQHLKRLENPAMAINHEIFQDGFNGL